MPFRYDTGPGYAYEIGLAPMERLLEEKLGALCREEGLRQIGMTVTQRLFLTHYRCSACKLLPLYRLDLTHTKKARCGKCGQMVSFTSAGKYGKMRKKLAFMLWHARSGQYVP
jgi:hypothetical protein